VTIKKLKKTKNFVLGFSTLWCDCVALNEKVANILQLSFIRLSSDFNKRFLMTHYLRTVEVVLDYSIIAGLDQLQVSIAS